MARKNERNELTYQRIAAVNNMLSGVTLEHIMKLKGGHIRYSVYIDAPYMNADITDLELSARAQNGLLRARYRTIKEVVEAIQCNDDLKGIRGMGSKSSEEIMLGIFLYQFHCLAKEKRQLWLEDMLRINGISNCVE